MVHQSAVPQDIKRTLPIQGHCFPGGAGGVQNVENGGTAFTIPTRGLGRLVKRRHSCQAGGVDIGAMGDEQTNERKAARWMRVGAQHFMEQGALTVAKGRPVFFVPPLER